MNNKNRYDLSLIIACYNEEPHLLKNVNELEDVLNQTPYSYEVIFIDDCSEDNTREIIKKICEGRNNSRYIFHEKNVGRGGTVREGLLLSASPYAGFLDIDLEVHARYISSMVYFLNKGYDLVSVERVEKIHLGFNSLVRLILSHGYRLLTHLLLKMKSPDSESGYKFFSMSAMREIIKNTGDNGWFWDTEVISRAESEGKKIKFIKGVFDRNPDKKSTVRVVRDTIAYLKAIFKFRKNRSKNL